MQKRALHRIGANSLWLAGERVLRLVTGLFVLGYVARYLGKESFGILNYAISITALLAAVANMGLDGVVIRELVKQPNESPRILGTAWILKLIGGAACAVTLGLAAAFSQAPGGTAFLVFIVSMAFLPQSFEVVDLWFQRHIQSKYTVLAKIGSIVLSAATKITLVYLQAPLPWFAAAQVLDMTLFAFGLLIVYRRQGGQVSSWRFSTSMANLLMRDSWPLVLSGIVVAVYMRIEQFLVMDWLGPASAGVYYASVRITDIWNMLPGLLLPSLYPLLLQKREENLERYQHRLQDVFDLLTLCGLAVAISVTLLAPWIIYLIYGSEFSGAVSILMIQAWAAPFTFNGSVRAQYFVMERLTLYHTWSAFLGIAVNVAMAVWLIPKMGARGAALAAVLGYAVSAYLSSLIFRELRPCAKIQTRAFLAPFRLPTLLAHFQKAK